jgi:hypothetical protein
VRPLARPPGRTWIACFAGWTGHGLARRLFPRTPLSLADCGRHFQGGGSGLLGLASAMGAFDREAGADCRLDYAARSYGGSPPYIPPNDVRMPPDPAPLPLPDNRQRLLVPAGGGNLMEIGGGAPQLMVPAGGGTFMEIP